MVPKMKYRHFFIGSISAEEPNNKTTLILAAVVSTVPLMIILVTIIWIRKFRWGEPFHFSSFLKDF